VWRPHRPPAHPHTHGAIGLEIICGYFPRARARQTEADD